MAPKKNVGKKGNVSKSPAVVDALFPTSMSKEELEKHIVHLREELDWEQEEHNYFQLEHDMMHTLWEITCWQLEEKRAELCNKDWEVEEQHQVEIKVYKQKVKHLLYKHQENLTELTAESILYMKLAQGMELQKDKFSLKVKLVRNGF
ncbi:dynein regulatory complex subunit 4-like [Melopsittacus undulatus]|uniref:Uncharacterized protein n=1 Tax=Melopsittacus undulatus TaxID=13146 RepID=A0A8V5GXC0_MELUD|nr:dynein regulatory complex subunit 4-like [Melopsittacus undulatus]